MSLRTPGIAAATSAMFELGEWYDDMDKRSWTPLKLVFPLAWTFLYIAMSVAAALVAVLEGNAYAMAFYAVQLAFNTLWTPIFVGLKRMGAGMVVILCLWATVAATMVAFVQLDSIAGALFLPYLLWVTIASALNFSVWRRNPVVA